MMKYFMFNLYFTGMITLPLDQRKQGKEKSYFMFINIKIAFLSNFFALHQLFRLDL